MKYIFQLIAISLIVLFTSCANAAQDEYNPPVIDSGSFAPGAVFKHVSKADSVWNEYMTYVKRVDIQLDSVKKENMVLDKLAKLTNKQWETYERNRAYTIELCNKVIEKGKTAVIH